MANPPTIHLLPGGPQAVGVVVTANSVQPDGQNPGAADTTTPLTLAVLSGTGFVIASIDPANNRRVVLAPGSVNLGSPPAAWSVRVSASGRSGTMTISGDTAAPPDVSGVSWDGVSPGPA